MLENTENRQTDVTAVVRTLALLARIDADRKPTPDDCWSLPQWADAQMDRVIDFLDLLDGEDGEQLAESLDWPSAAALRDLVHKGLLPHEKTH